MRSGHLVAEQLMTPPPLNMNITRCGKSSQRSSPFIELSVIWPRGRVVRQSHPNAPDSHLTTGCPQYINPFRECFLLGANSIQPLPSPNAGGTGSGRVPGNKLRDRRKIPYPCFLQTRNGAADRNFSTEILRARVTIG